MARQTSLHHRSNQTRNRYGWRCLAERKLRLRVRQYGERYLWFESISLHQEVRASDGSFPDPKILRHYKALAGPSRVSGGYLAGLSGFCGGMPARVSGRKIPFPKCALVGAREATILTPQAAFWSSPTKTVMCWRRSASTPTLANWPTPASVPRSERRCASSSRGIDLPVMSARQSPSAGNLRQVRRAVHPSSVASGGRI